MKDFSLSVLLAIAQEFLGWSFWLFVALAAFICVLIVVSFLNGAHRSSAIVRVSLWIGLAAGLIAFALAPTLTGAEFANVYGALDWIALFVLAACAFVAAAVTIYGIAGTFFLSPARGK